MLVFAGWFADRLALLRYEVQTSVVESIRALHDSFSLDGTE